MEDVTYLMYGRAVRGIIMCLFFFFNASATTEIYTLSLHDALPICLIAPVRTEVVVPIHRNVKPFARSAGASVPVHTFLSAPSAAALTRSSADRYFSFSGSQQQPRSAERSYGQARAQSQTDGRLATQHYSHGLVIRSVESR